MQEETFVTNILNSTANIHGYPFDITFRANIDVIITNKPLIQDSERHLVLGMNDKNFM